MAAVGTATHTAANLGGGVEKHTIAWTSDASGVVSGSPFAAGRGWLIAVKFVPSGGGTAPTNLYDVTIVDTDGVDVARGNGANLSSTVASVSAAPEIAFFGGGTLDLVIANAGNAKQGTAVLYIGKRN